MNLSQCKHIRIRNGEEYETNLETLIKSVELQFNTDFTSISNWKELVKCIDDRKQKYEKKIKSATIRKWLIINKLHLQQYRLSPFTLTDKLARTASLWQEIEAKCRKRKDVPKTESASFYHESTDLMEEISDMKLTAHPNSEVLQSEDFIEPIIPATAVEDEIKSSVTHLPVFICTNPHKTISPVRSQCSSIRKQTTEGHEIASVEESEDINCNLNNQTKYIKCKPDDIVIDNTILEKQHVKFYLTNTSTEALNLKFVTISDTSPFKKASVYPKTPVKLYPGLSGSFKFNFRLTANINSIKLFLYFRIGRNVLFGVPDEFFCVPVSGKSINIEKSILVAETVNIKPVYSWQMNVKSYFPKGYLEISVPDNNFYYIYIRKREVDFAKESDDGEMSVEVIGLDTDSAIQRMEEDDLEIQSELFFQPKNEELLVTVESANNVGFISLVVDDIVKLALETFVFEKTFLYLSPYSSYKVLVLFSKAEHEGYHQCYYELECYDTKTESLVITKTIKVFADVLTHPVSIHPNIFDMSESPVNFGFREDRFVVSNTHKLYPVTLKIELSKKMRRLFCITPMEMTVPYNSSASVNVRVCSKNNRSEHTRGELVHFTIKIILSGHKSIYRNVPSMFYEIIVPCVEEFEKIYGSSTVDSLNVAL